MTLPKRDWMEMTWADIAAAGEAVRRWIAVLPLAAVEQHGPHLPLGVDAYIAEAYLARVRKILPEALPATFLPVQRVGVSAEHLGYPGTLTLSAATAIKAWTEIGESLARAGLRKLLLVTSHGGNVAAMELVARDLRTRLGMLAVTVGWHRFGYPEGTFSNEERRHGIHGGDIETSLMLAAMPDAVRTERAAQATPATVAMAHEFKWLGAYRPAGFAWMTQDLNATGAVGDATQASAAKGEAALAHGAQTFVELVREMDRFDLTRLREGPLGDSAYDLSPRINR
ncbi:MAG TPA: creatininase family protein [Xanthobacteraceae bacterium]|jgi:creatinine amidohydrolase|nr:creatininase family protein [Xanthobacteraceae bacterium]